MCDFLYGRMSPQRYLKFIFQVERRPYGGIQHLSSNYKYLSLWLVPWKKNVVREQLIILIIQMSL